jgi:uncharacterized protein YdeI (YjbR/CyaY-like superfamily)
MQLFFEDRGSWRQWLADNHATVREVWLVFFKKHTGTSCIAYDASVEEALCVGWIDSIVKGLDGNRYLRKFTPRTNRKKWSQINVRRFRKLVAAGRMTQAGLAVFDPDVEAATTARSIPLEVPQLFADAFAQNQRAREHFDQLAPSHRRNMIGWVTSAKREETKIRRLTEVLSLLERGEKLGLK